MSKVKKEGQRGEFIPKQIWVYSEDPENDEEYTHACMKNTFKVAEESGFKVNVVNKSAFFEMVGKEKEERFKKTMTALNREATNNPVSGYESILPFITRDLVLLELVHKFGGIALEKDLILTEKLDWLWSLSENAHVNTGKTEFPTKYFAFFNVNFTTN